MRDTQLANAQLAAEKKKLEEEAKTLTDQLSAAQTKVEKLEKNVSSANQLSKQIESLKSNIQDLELQQQQSTQTSHDQVAKLQELQKDKSNLLLAEQSFSAQKAVLLAEILQLKKSKDSLSDQLLASKQSTTHLVLPDPSLRNSLPTVIATPVIFSASKSAAVQAKKGAKKKCDTPRCDGTGNTNPSLRTHRSSKYCPNKSTPTLIASQDVDDQVGDEDLINEVMKYDFNLF